MARRLTEQEFDKIRDAIIASLPPGLNEGDVRRQFDARMAQAIGEAEQLPEGAWGGPEGSSTWRFVKGAAESLNPVTMATGLYQAVRHPIQTATDIGKASIDQGKQAYDAYQQGDYSRMVGHGLGIIPVIGPAAANVGEELRTALETDGDIAGALGRATGLVVTAGPGATKQAVKSTARVPVAVGSKIASRVPGARRLASHMDEIAAEKLVRATAPQGRNAATLRMQGQMRRAAPSLLREPDLTGWTRSGFQRKLGEKLDEARDGLDAATDQRIANRPIDTSEVLTGLSDAQQQYVSEAIQGSRVTPRARPIEAEFSVLDDAPDTGLRPPPGDGVGSRVYDGQVVDDTIYAGEAQTVPRNEPIGRDVLPPEKRPGYDMLSQTIREVQALGGEPHMAHYDALANIRDARDITARKIYTPSVVADYDLARAQGVGASQSAGVIRDVLAKQDPATKAANARYRLFADPHAATVARAELESAAPQTGRQIFSRMLGTMAGSAIGGQKGAVIGAVTSPAIDQMLSALPTTQIKQARAYAQGADLLRGRMPAATPARVAPLTRALLFSRLFNADPTTMSEDEAAALEDELLRRSQP